jgi:hypothetical protein
MTAQPLTALKIGAAGTVSEIKLRPDQRGRLLEMGLLVGTPSNWSASPRWATRWKSRCAATT